MDELMLLTFVLLFIKHYIVDFPWQTQAEIDSKGTYGEIPGIIHSLKHGFGTAIVFFVTGPHVADAWILGVIDAVIHYHIDWVKMHFGCRDISQKRFWNELGLDQLAHYLTYALLVWMVWIW